MSAGGGSVVFEHRLPARVARIGEKGPTLLEMRAQCERCGRPVPPDAETMVCAYECTFCVPCAEVLGAVCPNCSGELVRRPRAGRARA
jgi:hypothetical protein